MAKALEQQHPNARMPKGTDPFVEGGQAGSRSEGNRPNWETATAEERSEWGRKMQEASQAKIRAKKAEAERIAVLQRSTLSPEQFKRELVDPKAVLAIEKLWEIAEAKNDKDLLRWFAEQKIGKPGSKAEIEHTGGVVLNIVRPPRAADLELEVVEETG